MCVCVFVCVRTCARIPQAGRAREGRGRRSHGARTDVVLTALRGDAQGRAGWRLPSWAHSVTAFTKTTKTTATTPIVTNLDIVIRH